MGKNNDNRSVTEKVNEVLAKFSHSELKKETALPKNEYKAELPWALAQINSCIGKVEKVISKDGETESLGHSFKRAPAFDGDTMNFHVFPQKLEVYNHINDELKEKVEKMEEVLEKDWYKDWIFKIHGTKGRFTIYSNWLNLGNVTEKINTYRKRGNIYKCLSVYYHGKCYYLNFMRFYQTQNETEGGRVNCDFYALQYDCVVCGKGVNSTNDANVCDVCYPFSPDDGDCHVNSVGNICYNPCISYYKGDGETEEMHNKAILDDFKNFIKTCDKLITEKNKLIKNELREFSVKEFYDVLGKINKETPKTKTFDEEFENGERKWGQKKDRWWDSESIQLDNENMSRQKFHVHGHFLCKCYGNIPSKCPKGICAECYIEKNCNPKKTKMSNDKEKLKNIYNGMNRPEMYLFIAEALDILNETEFDELVEYIKQNIVLDPSKPGKVCEKIRERITWDMVKAKVKELL